MSNKWPSDYPKGVPPEDAMELEADLYRMVKKDVPDEEDFLPTYKDPEQKPIFEKNKDKPESYGTSFFADKSDLEQVVSRFPVKFRKKKMCCCHIGKVHGKMQQTRKPSHHTVWFYVGVYPTNCRVIKNEK